MNIVDVQGGRYAPLSTPTGRLLWVDGEKGNDSLARRSFMTVPFATLNAAKNAASPGDTIVVMPGGYYVVQQLAANGINWHFLNGTVLFGHSELATALFEVSSNMTFNVTGAAAFDVESAEAHVLNVGSGGSGNIYFEAKSIVTLKSAIRVTGGATVVAKVDSILAYESCVYVSAGAVSVIVRAMTSDSLHGVYCGGGTLDVDAFQVTSASGGNGVLFSGGTARIRAFEIRAANYEAVEFTSGGTLTIQGARLVSEGSNDNGRAVYASGGASGIKLHNCVLISSATANESIAAAGPGNFTVEFHGFCTANKAKGTYIVGPSLTTSPNGFNYGTQTSIT